jgi:hypothetical protein
MRTRQSELGDYRHTSSGDVEISQYEEGWRNIALLEFREEGNQDEVN